MTSTWNALCFVHVGKVRRRGQDELGKELPPRFLKALGMAEPSLNVPDSALRGKFGLSKKEIEQLRGLLKSCKDH